MALDEAEDVHGARDAYAAVLSKLELLVASDRTAIGRKELMGALGEIRRRVAALNEYIGDSVHVEAVTSSAGTVGELAVAQSRARASALWDGVSGLEEAHSFIRDHVVVPAMHPGLFKAKAKPWKGLLLFGPSGTGKTLICRALQRLLPAVGRDVTVHYFSCARLVTNAGGGEQELRDVFRKAGERLRSGGLQTVLLLDDVDLVNATCAAQAPVHLQGGRKFRLVPERAARVKDELILGMRALTGGYDGLVVVATTRRPWKVDSALRRRFNKRVLCDLPDAHARRDLFGKWVRRESTVSEQSEDLFVRGTDGFDMARCANVLEAAAAAPGRLCQRGHLKEGTGGVVAAQSLNLRHAPSTRITLREVQDVDIRNALDEHHHDQRAEDNHATYCAHMKSLVFHTASKEHLLGPGASHKALGP